MSLHRHQAWVPSRVRHNLLVIPASEQCFERAQLDQRIDSLGRNGVNGALSGALVW